MRRPLSVAAVNRVFEGVTPPGTKVLQAVQAGRLCRAIQTIPCTIVIHQGRERPRVRLLDPLWIDGSDLTFTDAKTSRSCIGFFERVRDQLAGTPQPPITPPIPPPCLSPYRTRQTLASSSKATKSTPHFRPCNVIDRAANTPQQL